MNLKYILSAIFSILSSLFCFAQNDRIPILVNTLIGDTLSLEERNYFSLFPQIEGFKWAVFYFNSDSTVDAKVTYLRNSSQTDTLIYGFSTLPSLNYIMSLRPNDEHDKGAELIVYDTLGREITGELLSVRSNSMILLKPECSKDLKDLNCTWQTNYSEIKKVVIKDNSNLWLGLVFGFIASGIATGIIIHHAEKPKDGMFEDFSRLGLINKTGLKIVFSSIGLISLGALIGSLVSSDEVFDSFTEEDIKGLSAYSRFPYLKAAELKQCE